MGPVAWQREGRRSEGDEPAKGAARRAGASSTERSRLPCAASAEGIERDDLVMRLHAQLDISGGKDFPGVR